MHLFAITLAALAVAAPQMQETTSLQEAPPELSSPSPSPITQAVIEAPKQETRTIESFTGKVTKNRVRLRLQPTLEAPILKELSKDHLLVVTGIVDEFYAVLPAPQTKGYMFRTYILDGEIVGNHVNVRLEPDTNAPIICQLNSGEKITGNVAAANNKWLEIALPEQVRFYVAKEFVSRAGDVHVFYEVEKRRTCVEERLAFIEKAVHNEFQKSFRQIELAPFATELKSLIAQMDNLPQQAHRAQTLLKTMQEDYLQKSLTHKEVAAPQIVVEADHQDKESSGKAESEVACSEEKADEKPAAATPPVFALPYGETEKKLLQDAITSGLVKDAEGFYLVEQKKAVVLHGIIKPYARHVKNAPGDFVLLNPKTNLPIAYVYSTKVDLQLLVNKEMTITAVERPNNNFAYKAFFALKAE